MKQLAQMVSRNGLGAGGLDKLTDDDATRYIIAYIERLFPDRREDWSSRIARVKASLSRTGRWRGASSSSPLRSADERTPSEHRAVVGQSAEYETMKKALFRRIRSSARGHRKDSREKDFVMEGDLRKASNQVRRPVDKRLRAEGVGVGLHREESHRATPTTLACVGAVHIA